jgi:hypothetical protein
MSLPVVDPILPLLSRELPRGAEWRYELKLDGFRGTLYVEKKRAWFRSKTGRVMRRFDELARRVADELDARSAILDGEIVVMGERGPDFYALMFHRGVPQFAAFDLLWLDGRDLRPRAYTQRKRALRTLIGRRARHVSYVDAHARAELFDAAQQLDLEGIVAKRRDEPYAPGAKWIKVKSRGYSQMIGRWELFQKKRRTFMSRKFLVILVSLFLCASAALAKSMTPKANTHAEIKAYVERAAEHIARNGADCAAFKSADWMAGDYYIFVTGADEKELCHPDAKMIGKPASDVVDAKGKKVGTALIDAAKKGGGWVDYVWPRPGTTKPVPKSAYSMQVAGPDGRTYYVGAGGYELE